MESKEAAEHLQVIRTLMERSAIYRHALAPITLALGVLGCLGGIAGRTLRIESARGFVSYWMAISALGVGLAYLLARRQALRESEPFWSPPARRVTQALAPAFLVGMLPGILVLAFPEWNFIPASGLPVFWMLFYGCAVHAAGFFMTRGMRLLGLLFIGTGIGFMTAQGFAGQPAALSDGHGVMGTAFGGLHLAYGLYLYLTRKSRNAE